MYVRCYLNCADCDHADFAMTGDDSPTPLCEACALQWLEYFPEDGCRLLPVDASTGRARRALRAVCGAMRTNAEFVAEGVPDDKADVPNAERMAAQVAMNELRAGLELLAF